MSSVRSPKSFTDAISPPGWWTVWGIPGLLVLLFVAISGTISLTRHHIGDYGIETDFYWDYAPAADALLRGELPIERYSFRGPGYPLALAAGRLVTGDTFLAGKIISVLSAGISIWMIFYLLSSQLGPSWATIGTVIVAMNGVFLEYAIRAGTDMFFLALNLLFFLLIGVGRSRKTALAAGIVAGYTFLTRYNGAALILTLFIWGYFKFKSGEREKRNRALFAGCGVVATVVPWLFILYLITGNPFYSLNSANVLYGVTAAGKVPWDQFWYADPGTTVNPVPAQMTAKLLFYSRAYFENLTKHFIGIGDKITGWIVLSLALVGSALAAFRKIDISSWRWMVVASLLNYLILCSVFFSERFFLPLMPLIVGMALAVLSSNKVGGRGLQSRFGTAISVSVLCCVFLIGFPKNWEGVIDRLANDPVELLGFASRPEISAITGERLAARKPHLAYLTKNSFIPLPLLSSLDELIRWMRKEEVGYLFLDYRGANTRPALWALLGTPRSRPEFELIAYSTSPSMGLWRLCKEPSPEMR